jgi:hypothetical protein
MSKQIAVAMCSLSMVLMASCGTDAPATETSDTPSALTEVLDARAISVLTENKQGPTEARPERSRSFVAGCLEAQRFYLPVVRSVSVDAASQSVSLNGLGVFWVRPGETVFPAGFALTGGVTTVERGSFLRVNRVVCTPSDESIVIELDSIGTLTSPNPQTGQKQFNIPIRDTLKLSPDVSRWALTTEFPIAGGPPIPLARAEATFVGCNQAKRNCRRLRVVADLPLAPSVEACAGIYASLPGADISKTVTGCFVSLDTVNDIFPNQRVPMQPGGPKGPLIQVTNDVQLVFELGAATPAFRFPVEPPYLQYSTDFREPF